MMRHIIHMVRGQMYWKGGYTWKPEMTSSTFLISLGPDILIIQLVCVTNATIFKSILGHKMSPIKHLVK